MKSTSRKILEIVTHLLDLQQQDPKEGVINHQEVKETQELDFRIHLIMRAQGITLRLTTNQVHHISKGNLVDHHTKVKPLNIQLDTSAMILEDILAVISQK